MAIFQKIEDWLEEEKEEEEEKDDILTCVASPQVTTVPPGCYSFPRSSVLDGRHYAPRKRVIQHEHDHHNDKGGRPCLIIAACERQLINNLRYESNTATNNCHYSRYSIEAVPISRTATFI